MKDLYIYPAVFNAAEDGISVEFPDLPGCLTCGENMLQAMSRAVEALHLYLYYSEIEGDEIPEATSIADIKLGENETTAPIQAWMPPFREVMTIKATQN